MLRKEKAVTLVALIITIIVLLILAGVAFVALSGENGILKRAELARAKSDAAEQNETNDLDDMSNILGDYLIASGTQEVPGSNMDYDEFVTSKINELRPIDYSLEEQDTGAKWVDGKAIYKKTVYAAGPVGNGGTVTVSADVDRPIRIEGMHKISSTVAPFYELSHPSGTLYARWRFGGTYLIYETNTNWPSYDAYITAYYTKK